MEYDDFHRLSSNLPEVLNDGRYLICIEVEDDSGNTYCGPLSFYKKHSTQTKINYSIKETGTEIYHTIQNSPLAFNGINYKYYAFISYQYFDTTANTWKNYVNTTGTDQSILRHFSTTNYQGYEKGTELKNVVKFYAMHGTFEALLVMGDFNRKSAGEKRQKLTSENDQKSTFHINIYSIS